jgi:hypothetical protein
MLREFAARVAACAALAAAASSWAQQAPDFLPGTMGRPTSDAGWTEVEVPPPPPVRTDSLVAVDVPGTELRFGIDPQSVAIGADKVVRYVVVATSRSGAVNAMYEGVRCDRAEYRVYARYSGAAWNPVDTEWKPLSESFEGRRVRAIAQAGVCRGHVPNIDAAQIVRDLRAPLDRKFGGSGAP